jgi:serine/threonine protein kinase
MEEEMIANKYVLREFIGRGKFGSVYKGEKIGVGTTVAIKFEAKDTDIPLLKKEARILEYLARNGIRDRVPTVYWYGLHREDSVCVVMSYLGEQTLFNVGEEEKKTWYEMAKYLLERIHFYGVIHRDLKPAHFLFYGGKWKLIDFGFAVFVSDEDIVPEKKREYMIGSPNYISLAIHGGAEPGKKDDMISLDYIYLELTLGVLPWANVSIDRCSEYPINHLLHPANQFRASLKLEHSTKRPT